MTEIHYFGIRHHGPGSCKRLVAALHALKPHKVLIEGPADCNELLPMLAHAAMKPPVALLAYCADDASASIYYPMANYSPEYQACCWAVSEHADLAFIDLSVNIQLAQMLADKQKALSADSEETHTADDESAEEAAEEENTKASDEQALIFDPIGTLAKLAGYEDGEAWWNDLIEQNSDDDLSIFDNVEQAMSALRENHHSDAEQHQRDLQREAFMRLEIAKAAKDCNGPLAVVCGAWHVPALKAKHTAKADRDLLKQLPKKLAASKTKITWVPWTSTRLASATGYGAGVPAPMWYEHLWQQRHNKHSLVHWLSHIARAFRKHGQVVSTASVIEAVRLSHSLAAVRARPQPGFEEIREAVIACLCFGEAVTWHQVEAEILLGNEVGEIPEDVPLAPLLEDLQRLQKKTKLKPEALSRELALDLRSDAGHAKSILLHRLNILDVPWGQLTDSGGSRGTFRERWNLAWQPEYAVRLVENLVYGSTIELAASNKVSELLSREHELNRLADTVLLCLDAQLDSAADIGLKRLDQRAAHTSDCGEILQSLSPLITINRYGTARDISKAQVEQLILRLATQAAIALPYACRNLNDDESQRYYAYIDQAHRALQLAELDDGVMQHWWEALHAIVDSDLSSHLISGLCAHFLYQEERLPVEELQTIMQKMLSPALPAIEAANFFEGFFSHAVDRLIYDNMLLQVVEDWLVQLEEDSFVEFLPLFRRVFSTLDTMERKRLIDTIMGARQQAQREKIINTSNLEIWDTHFSRLEKLFKGDKTWMK